MLFLSLLLIKKDLNFKMEKEIHFALGSLAYFPSVPYRRVLATIYLSHWHCGKPPKLVSYPTRAPNLTRIVTTVEERAGGLPVVI
jgi:hypothetical protein